MNNLQYMSGTGNNFLISEYENTKTDIEIISIVADSLFDIDGVIFVEKINSVTVKMHYYNNDGSTAELCVNGIRCVAKYALDNSFVDSNEVTVVAPIGNIKANVKDNIVSLEVSIPTYDENKLLIDGLECIKSNIGNPHLLVEVENVDKFDLEMFIQKVYETNEFEFILPTSKTRITFKCLTQKDTDNIESELKGLKKMNRLSSPDLTTRLKHQILSVNNDYSAKSIREFVDNRFLARDSRAFREYSNEMAPDVDLTFDLTLGSKVLDSVVDSSDISFEVFSFSFLPLKKETIDFRIPIFLKIKKATIKVAFF